jgi:DNA-binding NtrC family response regulator
MTDATILVVDDEKNTRLTLEQALEPLGYRIRLAASGEEALAAIDDRALRLVLLDLRMPGIDGLAVLRQIEQDRPDVRVLVLTAHGTVDSAVDAMKHGALDVMQKPFSVEEIREAVGRIMDPAVVEAERSISYEQHIERARNLIVQKSFDAALAHLHRAVQAERNRPEAHNLMGVIDELRHNRVAAQRHYRTALEIDSKYAPARENLHASTGSPGDRGRPSLGGDSA